MATSWEHQREVRDALRTIVSDPQLGVPALSSAQTMSNLLKDLLPDAPRETSVLVAAAEAGLAGVLRDHLGQGMDLATASSLTASAFEARTPFTTDACRWVVGELSVALGYAPPDIPPASGPQAGTILDMPRGPGLPPATPATVAETVLPRSPGPASGSAAAPGRAAPGHAAGPTASPPATPGYGTGPATSPPPAPGYGAGPAASPQAAPRPAPPSRTPAARPAGGGYAYPPPAPGPAAGPGYGYGAPGQGGYGYPPPAPRPPAGPGYGPYPAAPGQGGAPTQRRRRAWPWILVGAGAVIVILIVLGAIGAVLKKHNAAAGTETLSQIVQPAVVGCKTTPSLGMTGLSHREFCTTKQSHIGLDAYQFSSAAAFSAGLSRWNNLTGWDSGAAGTKCPPASDSGRGQTQWHSNVNTKYSARAGQVLECYPYHGYLLYVWTLPTQRVILVANDNAPNATFAELEKWWSGLNYG